MNKNNLSKNLTYIVILVLIGLLAYSFLSPKSTPPKKTTISEIAQEVKEGKIEKITVQDNEITAKIKDGGEEQAYKEAGIGLNEYGITADKVNIEVNNPNKNAVWTTIASIVLPFILVGIFLWLIMRQAQGSNIKALSFGKTTARLSNQNKKTTFHDVAGLVEAKQELMEVVEFLKNRNKFKELGAEIPKGVLLIGPPGTGKTLLSRAVAGEAAVPFFSISASEFVEMFVGVGAARVRDLFEKAKRNAPCVVFIDELDAVGRQRGTGLGGSHDEREQTLNQILVEMDGFEPNSGVVVISATNRPDVLDPALLRPGRFDRRVVLDLPDMKERLEIIKLHAKGKPLTHQVDLEKIARASSGFSGADLKNVLNESAILAARNNRKEIVQNDLSSAIEKVMLGPERKSRILSQKEKKIASIHECGHVIVGKSLKHTDPVHKVSIVSRGMALGYTWSLPLEDRRLYSKSKFEDEISQLLGGWAAEKLIYGETTTGAQNDLKKATRIARDMITIYGMSDSLGPVSLGEREEMVFLGKELGEHKTYSEQVAAKIDREISTIIGHGQKRAAEILSKKKNLLKKISEKLLEKETLESKELDRLFNKNSSKS